MAGKVANFTHQHMRNAEFLNPDSMFEQNMEEDEVLNHLSDKSFDKRVEILEQLRGMVRRNGGRLPFHNQRTIFRGLSMALDDGNWNVRHQCIQLIHELLPSLGDDIDECMWIVLPQLVPNLGDTKITIRRAVIQTIHVYMKYTADVQQIFKSIVKHGLENHDPKIKKEVTIALPMLFTPEYSHENFNRIAQALAKRLLDNNVGDDGESIQQHALLSLHKIKNLVGDRAFNEYLDNLSPQLKRFYYKLTDPDGVYTEQLSNQSEGATSYGTNGNNSKPIKKGSNTSGASSGLSYHSDITNDEYEFGVIPCHIMAKLNDHSNYRARGQAIEELKLILRELKDVHALEPHVLNFISFLNNLLDDNNFKITTATLEIMGILVQKLNVSVKPYLKPLVSALTKCMHDSKIVWRQVIMKVVMQLMHVLSPKPVLSVICENLAHRNSKVRQEALNIVIASLLTFPSYDFDLGVLCQTIAHTLIDPKRQVRQAALESFAVLAQAMGAGKLQPLVQAVDSVELSYDGDGVMGAVQARLARRQLPKLNADGLVDYATPIPSSAGSRGGNSVPATTLPHGADIEWILSAAGGSGSSARSDRQDMELQSVYSGSSARSTPNSVTDGPTPRHASRVLSSGKNKNRMPWNVENLAPQDQTAVESKQSSQNTSWRVNDQSKSDSPKRVHHVKHLEQTPQESGPVPSSGSYRQTYLNRMKRQQSDGVAQPFSVYNPNKEDDGFAFVSTPRTGGTDDSSVRVSFSQSWPDPKMFEDAGKPPKRFLDPISADSHAGASDWEDDRKKDVPNIPIATKPTLVRTNSSRASSKRKVPPIPVNRTSMVVDRQDPEVGFIDVPDTSREMIKDTSRDTSRDSAIDGMIDDIDEEAMAASLRRIRNSATKKVEQMFKEAKEKSRSPSPDTLEESGIFSNLSTLRSHYPEIDPQDSGMSTPKKRGKKGDLPFGNKPQLARKSTNQPPKSDMKSEKSSQGSDPTFNPVGGVTFKENPNFDVAIEGKGYAEDSHFTEPKPSGPSKARDRRRVNKGMFDNSGGNSGDPASSGSGSNGFTGARRASRTNDMHNLPRGVYGVKVRHNSDNRQSSDGESDEEEDVQVSMAQSMRESMALKQETLLKQAKEDEELAEIRAEQAKMAAEREQKAKEKRIAERQRQAENRKKAAREAREAAAARDADADSVNGGLAISGKNNSTPSIVKKPASTTGVTPKAKGKRILLEGQRRAEHGMVNGEPIAEEELEAFSDPNSALNAALKAIGSEDWNEKCDGISGFRRLTAHHSDTLQKELSAVILALTNEVKNLRSSVCRMSAICLGEMFFQLKKKMDPHVDKIVQLLLSKTGENAAKFLVADAEAALLKMADNVSPARAVVGLMVGVGHKNVLVRKAASNIMAYLVDRIGPGEVLTGKKDITDKILSSASQFIQDSAPETRWNGQKIFHILMDDPRFEQQFNKHVPENTRNNIKDKLETLRRKGLPDNPVDHSSARHRREINRTNSSSTRQNSASSGAESVVVSPMKQPRSGTVRTDERTMDDIKAMCQQMAANDWRERSSAIDKFVDMMQKHPNAVCNNITKIFDKFIPLLRDSNSKVNIQALKTLDDYLGVISPYLSTVMALTVETVSHNLSSKNKEIYDTATSVLDNMMEQIDASQLLQPFVAVCQGGTIRIKPDMIERTAFLATNVKAKMVKIHVLPLLWTLLKNPSSSAGTAQGQTDLPNALNTLVHSVHGVLGEELFQIANSTTSVTPRMQQTLRDIAEQN